MQCRIIIDCTSTLYAQSEINLMSIYKFNNYQIDNTLKTISIIRPVVQTVAFISNRAILIVRPFIVGAESDHFKIAVW